MPYPSDRQISRAIRVLLHMHQMADYWSKADIGGGPADKIFTERRRINDGESLLSTGEQIILRVCLDLWSQSGNVSLAEIVQQLDPMVAHCIGELLMAIGSETPGGALDEWVAKWRSFDAKATFSP